MAEEDNMTISTEVATNLAAHGLSSRIVKFKETYGVEISFGPDGHSAVWAINPERTAWAYISFGPLSEEGGQEIESQGTVIELPADAPAERVAWVAANFPYGGEMEEDDVRKAVAELLDKVDNLTEEERSEILTKTIAEPERPESGSLGWESLGESGLAWAINRYILNPAGFSFVMVRDADRTIAGWTIVGDGAEPYTMEPITDANGFSKFGAWIEAMRNADA